MSEGTFRGVVAAVLVGALALAAVAVILIAKQAGPAPSTSPTTAASGASAVPSGLATPPASGGPTASTAPATATPVPPHVFGDVGVGGVGNVARGASSAETLTLHFVEPARDAIADGPGSFLVTLTDASGSGATVTFSGGPTVAAPGSLGATAALVAGNVLRVDILASDVLNVESIDLAGFGIDAAPGAALGPVRAVLSDFTGSLSGGVATPSTASPGTVVAGP